MLTPNWFMQTFIQPRAQPARLRAQKETRRPSVCGGNLESLMGGRAASRFQPCLDCHIVWPCMTGVISLSGPIPRPCQLTPHPRKTPCVCPKIYSSLRSLSRFHQKAKHEPPQRFPDVETRGNDLKLLTLYCYSYKPANIHFDIKVKRLWAWRLWKVTRSSSTADTCDARGRYLGQSMHNV